MNEIKSIWDGWTNQAFGIRHDGRGSNCALGWLDRTLYGGTCFWEARESDVMRSLRRVADFIRANYPLTTDQFNHGSSTRSESDTAVIAAANNALMLTPEQFREIDRLTQIEAAVKPLVDSVPLPSEPTAVDSISYLPEVTR